jgi:uncharacterized membrane protein YkoI
MRTLSLLGLTLLLLHVSGSVGRTDEKKIPLHKVPKSVLEAVKAKFENAKLTGAEEETEDGKTTYDIAFEFKAQKYEAAVTPEGKLTGYEKRIGKTDLPRTVDEAVKARYPDCTVKGAEEVYKVEGVQDKLESYEVAITTRDNKKMEVVVSPDGKIRDKK